MLDIYILDNFVRADFFAPSHAINAAKGLGKADDF